MTKISFLLHETQKSKVCIPDNVGIEALLHYFETRPIEVLPPNEFLLSLTEIILSRNFFQYAGAYYLQRPGVSIRSPPRDMEEKEKMWLKINK